MEQETNVTPTGQDDVRNVDFDEHGELKFTEAGLAEFKELLKAPVPEMARQPETQQEEPETTETGEETPKQEESKQPEKKKIKVDGQEIELTEEELIARAQQGEDYTRKMQRLSEERNALAPYQALLKQLQTDPDLSRHIAGYWQQKQQTQVPEKPKFADPIDELKWEMKQEALAEMRQELNQTLQGVVSPMQRQQVLNQVRSEVQRDPDFEAVRQSMLAQIAELPGAKALFDELGKGQLADLRNIPPSLAKNVYLQLDQDPNAYLSAFGMHKERVAAKKAATANPNNNPTETSSVPDPKKRTERAPILESPNSAPTDESVRAQAQKVSKAKAAALRSGSVEALQGFLEAGGFLDHLK